MTPLAPRKCSVEMLRKITAAYFCLLLAVTSLTSGEVSLVGGRLNWWSGNASVIWGLRSGASPGLNLEMAIEPAWRWSPPQLHAERSGGRIATPIGPWALLALALWLVRRRGGRRP